MKRVDRNAAIRVPRPLRRGDLVGVVAAGSSVDRRAVEAGIEVLQRLGLRVRTGAAVFAHDGEFAGSDAERARDLIGMLRDDEVRAVHFARGGWGASRFLGRIPWSLLARTPKTLIGYSDVTSIFAPALDRCRLSCVYGPLVTELGDPRTFHRGSLTRAYYHPGSPLTLRFPRRSVLAPGRARGRASGGCLTLLAHLAGTVYAPALRGRVLLIEDVGEPPYRIDRMLTQLDLAGMLRGVAGVLVGSMSSREGRVGSGPTALEVVAARFRERGIPVVARLPFGHIERKVSIPLGFRVRIDTTAGRIDFAP